MSAAKGGVSVVWQGARQNNKALRTKHASRSLSEQTGSWGEGQAGLDATPCS